MNSGIIFIDQRAPVEAIEKLKKWGRVVAFFAPGIVYDVISGHPDIFMYQHPGGVVVAPQMPARYLSILDSAGITITIGETSLGNTYPQSAAYNASWTPWGVIHNTRVSCPQILQTHSHHLHCSQAYARCNALYAEDLVFTSDPGIEKILKQKSIPFLHINPKNIHLPGVKHGFFPGCCGYADKKLFVCGSIDNLPEADLVRINLQERGIELVEIFSGTLTDVGGIFFL